MGEEFKISVLEETHALKILLILSTERKMVKGELAARVAKGTVAVQSRIESLISEGLITETQERTKPFRKYIELTKKGMDVSVQVAAIEMIMRT
jgi:DNA-binding HxlR family transcriptional regulator